MFSADDWQCSKCGNVNWARRQQCNMCNAPKFGEVEERTGYGGGYNDRGVVEYKERRDDDDDEYDEFGRRRKKRKIDRSDDDSKDSKYSSPPRSKSKDSSTDKIVDESEIREVKNNVNTTPCNLLHHLAVIIINIYLLQFNEEDNEDEDDDEEGDLSKYDLSEWDDFVPEKKRFFFMYIYIYI